MKDTEEELEKTKPIDLLSEISSSRAEKFEDVGVEKVSREEKFQEQNEQMTKKEQEEAAEEALAEKNIQMAEEMLEEENRENERKISEMQDRELGKDEEKKPSKIKEFWDKLSKKKKIMIFVILFLIVFLLIILISYILMKPENPEKPEEKPETPVVEQVPVVTDNFYYKDGVLHFLNEVDKEIGTYECENKDSELCYVAENNYRDDFDVEKLQNDKGVVKVGRVPIYSNKYVFVYDNKDKKGKNIKLYSMDDKKVINTYTKVKAYDNKLVIVADSDSKYGLLDMNSGMTEAIKPDYTYLGMINGQDNLIAKTKKGYYVINNRGKTLSAVLSASLKVKNYNNHFIVVDNDEDYDLYDYKGTLLKSKYDYISLIGSYAALVDTNKKVYVVDAENNKYNEGNIKVDNRNFIKTYVYDDDGELVKIKRSFEMTLKNDTIEFAIYQENNDEPNYITLDLAEGMANKKNKYVNYFDGKLYFYKDEAKDKVLGIYTCNNRNDITKEEDTFDYCFIAKDTIYEDNDMMGSDDANRKAYVPIINDRYVFIADGVDVVRVYDLQNNALAVQAPYKSVNSYTENNNYEVTKKSGTVDVVAYSTTSNKYGVVSVGPNGLSPKFRKYAFVFDHIEKVGKYYVLFDNDSSVDEDDGWFMNYTNDQFTNKMPGKIMGYDDSLKYFKVKVDNSYSVYNANGQIISTDTYAYVELYDTYFVGIDSNRMLNIYDYQGIKLSGEGVQIGNYPYNKTDTPAFKVKKNGDKFEVSVYDGSNYTLVTVGGSGGSNPSELEEQE